MPLDIMDNLPAKHQHNSLICIIVYLYSIEVVTPAVVALQNVAQRNKF
jgi:hypothetical protein